MSYRPSLSGAEVARIRRWHEAAYTAAKAEAGDAGQTFDYLGHTIAVPPTVQPITRMSHLLGTAVLDEVRPGDRVLDMGTGSGVNAVLAAGRGARVLAVDINPDAVAAASANVERNGVAGRVEVRESDVFAAVDRVVDGVFDLIVFDPPFRWFAPRDRLEAAMTDENYRAMTEFFDRAGDYLAPAGRMLVAFGSSGDIAYLRHRIDVAGFTAEEVNQAGLNRNGVVVEYFTFRITRAGGW